MAIYVRCPDLRLFRLSDSRRNVPAGKNHSKVYLRIICSEYGFLFFLDTRLIFKQSFGLPSGLLLLTKFLQHIVILETHIP
jgi:hypothetical protein